MDIISIEGSCEQNWIKLLCGTPATCYHNIEIKRFGNYGYILLIKCLAIADKLTNQNPVKAAMFRTLYSQVSVVSPDVTWLTGWV